MVTIFVIFYAAWSAVLARCRNEDWKLTVEEIKAPYRRVFSLLIPCESLCESALVNTSRRSPPESPIILRSERCER